MGDDPQTAAELLEEGSAALEHLLEIAPAVVWALVAILAIRYALVPLVAAWRGKLEE